MFRNVRFAHSVQVLVFSLQKDLNQSVSDLQGKLEESEWCSYRLGVAHVLSSLFEGFTANILLLHPRLESYQNRESVEKIIRMYKWPLDNILQRILKDKACSSHFPQSFYHHASDAGFEISDYEVAVAIETLMFFIRRTLFDSLDFLCEFITYKEWRAYCKAATCVVNEINMQISIPLYKMFPELIHQLTTSFYPDLLVCHRWPEDNILQRVIMNIDDE